MSSSSSGFRTRPMHKIRNDRYSDQPFAGKTFYMDIKVPSVLTKLCQRVVNLGGEVENFLSKDVSLLITDKIVNADDTKDTGARTKVGSSVSNSLGPISRGRALLLKATSMQPPEMGTSNNRLLQIAINLGVKVETVDSFLYSTSKLMARVKRQKNSLAKQMLRKDMLSGVAAVKWDAGKENTFFVKVEDDQCLYKPLFKQFESFPTIVYSESGSPFDVGCPFDVGVVLTKLDKNKQSKKKLAGGAVRGGYCESCCHWYKCTMSEHLNSAKHTHFADTAENFGSLNEIISKILDSKNLEDRFKLPNALDSSSGVVYSINNLAITQDISQAISPHLQLTSAQYDSTTMSALNDACRTPPLRNSEFVSYRSCIGISDTGENSCATQTKSNVESCSKMVVDDYQDIVVNSIPETALSKYLSCLSQNDHSCSNDSIKRTDNTARQRTSCKKEVNWDMKNCFTAMAPRIVIDVSSCEIEGDDVANLDQQVKLVNFGLTCVNKVFHSGGLENVLLDSKDAQATDIVMDSAQNNGQSCKLFEYLERPFEVFSCKSVVDLDVGNQINYWCQRDAYIPDCRDISDVCPDPNSLCQQDGSCVTYSLCRPDAANVPNSLSQSDAYHVPDNLSQPDASHVPDDLSQPDACEALDCISQPNACNVPDDLSKPDACEALDCISQPNACNVPDDLSKPDACQVTDSQNKPDVCHVSVCVGKPAAFIPEFSSFPCSYDEIGVKNVLSLLNSNISNHASIKRKSSSLNSDIRESAECTQNPSSGRQSTVSENIVKFEVAEEGSQTKLVTDNSVWKDEAEELSKGEVFLENYLSSYGLPDVNMPYINMSGVNTTNLNMPDASTHKVESFDYKDINAFKMPVKTWFECSSKLISDPLVFPNEGISNLSQSFDKGNVEPVDGSEVMRNLSSIEMEIPNRQCFHFSQKQTHNANKIMSGVLMCVANPNYSNITEESESENMTTCNNPGIQCNIESMNNVTPMKKNQFRNVLLRNVTNSGSTVRNWLLPRDNESLKSVGENFNVMLADNQLLHDLSFFKDMPNECSEDDRKVADWILNQTFDKYQTVGLECSMQRFENNLLQTVKDSYYDTDVYAALEDVSGDMINKMNTAIEEVSEDMINEEMDTALKEVPDDLINEIHTTVKSVHNNMINEMDTTLQEMPDNMIKDAEFCVQSDKNNNTCAYMSDGTWSDSSTSISDDTIENFHTQTVETKSNAKSEKQFFFNNLNMEANDLFPHFCQHDESNKAVDEIRLPSSKETENVINISSLSLKSSEQSQNLQKCYENYATYIKEQLEASDFLIEAMRNNEESANLNTNVEVHELSPEQYHVKEVETKMESLYQPIESFQIMDIGHSSTNEMEEKQHGQTPQQVELPDLKLIDEITPVTINRTLSLNNRNICGQYGDKLQINETDIPQSNLCQKNLVHFDYDETLENSQTYLYSRHFDATETFYQAFINGQYCYVDNSGLFYAGFQSTLDQSTNFIAQNTSAVQQYVHSIENGIDFPLSQRAQNNVTNETFESYATEQHYETVQHSHRHNSDNSEAGSQGSTDSQRTVPGGLVLVNGFLVNANSQQPADDSCQTVHFLSSTSNFLAQNSQTVSSEDPNSHNLPEKSLSPNFLSHDNCRSNDDLSTIQQDDIAEDTSATNYCFQDIDTDTFNQPSNKFLRNSGNDSILEVCHGSPTRVLNSNSQVQDSVIGLSSANNDSFGHLENEQCIQTDYRMASKSVIPSSLQNNSHSHISVPATAHNQTGVFISNIVPQGNSQVQNDSHVSSSHCVTKSLPFVNHQRQALLTDTSQVVQPVPVYNAVQLGDTKIKLQKMPASKFGLQKMPASKVGRKSNLMQYWNVRKSGDCRLVFSSNMMCKRKAPGKVDYISSFCDGSNRLSANRDNEEQHATERQRCLMF